VILLDGVDDASHSDGRLRDEPLLEGRNVSGGSGRQLSERVSCVEKADGHFFENYEGKRG
jgi:hypothetical protein